MNAKQRRIFKRCIKKNLYDLIFKSNLYGSYVYNIYPSNARMYIDFPLKDERGKNKYIYVRIPSFHFFSNMDYHGRRGVFKGRQEVFKFYRTEGYESLKNIEGLTEIFPFDDNYPKQIVFPLFKIDTAETKYFLSPSYRGENLWMFKRMPADELSLYGEICSLETVLNDPFVNANLKKKLTFHLDIFR